MNDNAKWIKESCGEVWPQIRDMFDNDRAKFRECLLAAKEGAQSQDKIEREFCTALVELMEWLEFSDQIGNALLYNAPRLPIMDKMGLSYLPVDKVAK